MKRLMAWVVMGSMAVGCPGIVLAEDSVMAPAAPGPVQNAMIPADATPTVAEWLTASETLINTIDNYVPPAEGPAPTDDQAIAPIADADLPASPVFAEGEQPAPLDQAAISRLVRDLDSSDYRVRERASGTLRTALALGSPDIDVVSVLTGIGNEILQNPALLSSAERDGRLRDLVNGIYIGVRRRIVSELDTPQSALTLLARYDADPLVKAVAVRHPNMPSEGAAAIAARAQALTVLLGAARDPATSVEDLSFIARVPNQDVGVLRYIAENSSTWPGTLDFLAHMPNQNGLVLEEIARNPSTRPETLDFLAHMPNQNVEVLQDIARNPSTRTEALRFLAGNANADVRRAARAALLARGAELEAELEPIQP